MQAERVNRLRKGRVLESVTFDKLMHCYANNSYAGLNPYMGQDQQEKLHAGMQDFLLSSEKVLQMEKALKEKNPDAIGKGLLNFSEKL